MRRRLAFLCLSLSLSAGLPSQQEALAMAFPGAQFQRREVKPTADQANAVHALSGGDPGKGLLCFEATQGGRRVGTAYFDSHRVHSASETAMVAVSAEGRILRVEVVAFKEPEEYLANPKWRAQFNGSALDADLALGRRIHPLAGCTLTAQSLTDAARRALAWDHVLYGGKP